MRVYLGVHRFAPNDAIVGDMAWTPSDIRRKLAMLRFWNRLVRLDDERLTKNDFPL